MRAFWAWICSLFGHPASAAPVAPVLVPVTSCAHGCVIHRGSQGEIDGLKALGVTLARSTWYTALDSPAMRAAFQARLAALDAAGIESLIVVHDFMTRADVVPAIQSLTLAFPGRVWQVGNEYNGQPWREQNPGWGPGSTTGAFYAALMQQVVAVCPGVRFAGMGLAFNFAQAQYLADYLAAGGPMLDAWCIHVYGCPYNASVTVPETQAVLRGKMPLWITEYGVDQASMDAAWGLQTAAQCDAEQGKEMADLLTAAGSLGVSRTYYYCYWDDTDTGFGLVRKDESHRPAWDTMHALARSSI